MLRNGHSVSRAADYYTDKVIKTFPWYWTLRELLGESPVVDTRNATNSISDLALDILDGRSSGAVAGYNTGADGSSAVGPCTRVHHTFVHASIA